MHWINKIIAWEIQIKTRRIAWGIIFKFLSEKESKMFRFDFFSIPIASLSSILCLSPLLLFDGFSSYFT